MDDQFRKAKELCTINVEKKVTPSENIVYFREGWGNPNKGAFWYKGSFSYEAYIDGNLVGTRRFFVEEEGKVTAEENPYFNILSLTLFEGENKLQPKAERKYYSFKLSIREQNGWDALKERLHWIQSMEIEEASMNWAQNIWYKWSIRNK